MAAKKTRSKAKYLKREDGWQNAVTGFGTSQDKLTFGHFRDGRPISPGELLALYEGDDIAAKVVDFRPREMMRRGYEIRLAGPKVVLKEALPTKTPTPGALKPPVPGQPPFPAAKPPVPPVPPPPGKKLDAADPNAVPVAVDPAAKKSPSPADPTSPENPDEPSDTDEQKLENYAENLGANAKILEAQIQGRLFGGCLIVAGLDDGAAMSTPLREEKIRSVKYLNVIDCRTVQVATYYTDPLKPDYGEPQTYRIQTPDGGQPTIVHATRVLRFDGALMDSQSRRQNGGWNNSVLLRPYDRLRDFGTAFQSVSNLLADMAQGVFSIQGLLDVIASKDGAKELHARMKLVDMMRSSSRALVLDAELEKFERIVTPLAGVPDMLDRIMMVVSAAVDVPVSILFGRSAAGQNATGDMDFRAFYDTVASDQKNKLKPLLLRLYRWIAHAKDSGVKAEPKTIDISFNPIWEPSDAEKADTRLKVAQADNFYLQQTVLLPEEVAASRWPNGRWSMEMQIDVEARLKALQAGKSFDPYVNDPAPVLAPPVAGGHPGLPAPGEVGGHQHLLPAGKSGAPSQAARAPNANNNSSP